MDAADGGVTQQRLLIYTTDGQEWSATLSVWDSASILEAYASEDFQVLHISQSDPMLDWRLNKVNIVNIKVLNLEDVREGSGARRPPAKSRQRAG